MNISNREYNLIKVCEEEASEVIYEASGFIVFEAGGGLSSDTETYQRKYKELIDTEYQELYACSSMLLVKHHLPLVDECFNQRHFKDLDEISLLSVFIQRLSQVGINCSKAIRFGLEDLNPKTNLTNLMGIAKSVQHLNSFRDYLVERDVLCEVDNPDEVRIAKLERVEKFFKYSLSQNRIS